MAEAGKLRDIPGIIVQGRYDLLCSPATSHALGAAWREAEIRVVEGAGHTLYDPGVRDAVMKAIADIASRIERSRIPTMPMAGKGMLLTSMDIDASDEAEFNRWYDREHLEERVAIEGFLEARRYVAHQASPKYLCLYSTATIEVLDSPAYKSRLASPTEWSKKTMARFKNMIRAVARITISHGQGRGAVLGVIRLHPEAGSEDRLRTALRNALDPKQLDGIISMHLIENDPALSGPTKEIPSAASAGANDWFVLIDAAEVNPVSAAIATHFADGAPLKSNVISTGIYRLMWDLAKGDIPT